MQRGIRLKAQGAGKKFSLLLPCALLLSSIRNPKSPAPNLRVLGVGCQENEK